MRKKISFIFLTFVFFIPSFAETKVKTIKDTEIYDLKLNIVSSIEKDKQLFIEDEGFCYLKNR
ncbi:MAG: hypothetical protein K6E97_01880, partial [Treponema sp.]|nr:hypothetical protein [Treponema sp.]